MINYRLIKKLSSIFLLVVSCLIYLGVERSFYFQRHNPKLVYEKTKNYFLYPNDTVRRIREKQGPFIPFQGKDWQGFIIDARTDTSIYSGKEAKAFLSGREFFEYDTLVINIEDKKMVISAEGEVCTLNKKGIVYISGGREARFEETEGEILVYVMKKKEGLNERFMAYSRNFPSFPQLGWNESGIISPRAWVNDKEDEGIVVIERENRRNLFTGKLEPEWLIDNMVLSAPMSSVSMFIFEGKTDGFEDFSLLRTQENFHRHNEVVTEVYYIVSGKAAILYQDAESIKLAVLGPRDLFIAKEGLAHAIIRISSEDEYKHIAIQIPGSFHLGFQFKQTIMGIPEFLERNALSEKIAEILKSSTSIGGVFTMR
ncbi:MAG: hypothetical protein NC818_06030 [Candidatus Omnitrophica bacterium]|nr:hypothetical protein [Candidatus Omnitrophota bacterium]